jgi:thiol-disulfide isomerase/thioredoxin
LYYLTFIIFAFSCAGPSENRVKEQQVPIVDFEGLQPILNLKNDTTYVVNFWATWCTPCVKEIPYLETINGEYSNKKVKVILINLDFPNHYETRLLPFIAEKKLKSKVIMLDDPNANSWINLVNPNWSGSIPATLIYNKKERRFFEKAFELDELKQIVDEMLLLNNN